MRKEMKNILGASSCIAMLIIILDSRTAVSSITTGIELCLQTVVPALFPFLILSGIMNKCILGQRLRFMTPICRMCRIPTGSESILLIGLLSGYPVGAKLIAEAYLAGSLTEKTARRMLGFCSNAGPAFIFGIVASAFNDPLIPWVLWVIHIISALIVGFLLPGETNDICKLPECKPISVTQALNNAIKTIATICGWVILFRLILDYFNIWFLKFLPMELQVFICGAIELSNGCIVLQKISHNGVRFVLASAILASGGVCVAMQTASVTDKLGWGSYFPGKLLQTLLSVALSSILQPYLFPRDPQIQIPFFYFLIPVIFALILSYLLNRKKVVAFGGRMLYNTDNKCI